MKISFCGKCGTELLPDTSFCAYCGWKLPDEAERKIIESLNDSKQSNTDSSVVMPIESLATDNITEPSDVKKCISCVASLPQSAEFCSQCGAKQVEVTLPSGKYCSNCGNLMSLNDMFCSNCGANQNAEVKRQYDQVAPAVNTPKKKANGGIILISVMLLFIASIVGAVLFFGIGGVKADEVSGKWVVEFIIEDMSDDMDYYDFSDYIGETTEGTLIVDLDEDGNGTAKLVTTVDGTDYDYEVMEAQYDKGKLVCIADTKSESIEFTGNVRRKGDIYKLSGKFKMSFIEDVKTLSSGKWTATKDVNQTANSKQANSSSKKEKAVNEQSQKEEIPNLAINATMLDILGEWEGTAILSSFTGYEENRAWLLENNAPEDVIEQFDNMKGKESPIYLEIDDDYAWEVAVDVEPMGELSISDSDFGYDEAGNEIDGTMKLEKGSFQLAHSEREEGGSVAFSFSGSVLTNDDGSYAIKGSLTVSMTFDEGLVPFEMMFDYDMLRSVNTEE